MNEEKKKLVTDMAQSLGFADARVAICDGVALFFLFTPYRPAPKAEFGKINLSNYYVASQSGYLAAKKMIVRLAKKGVGAKLFQEHGVKRLALETGGFQGLNTLYYHEQYGSFAAIHVLETDFLCPPDEARKQDGCPACGNCVAACPTNAVREAGFARERCVRNYMCEQEVPEEYGRFIYQLLGCERCQTACPLNAQEEGEAFAYDLIEVIGGAHTKEIARLVGTNYGRRRFIVGQAMLYAANVGYRPALPSIEALFNDEFVGKTARRAAEALKKY